MRSNVSVHIDTTAHFSSCPVFLSRGNNCNQNLHSTGMGLHVDTTAHFSSYQVHLFCINDKYNVHLLLSL